MLVRPRRNRQSPAIRSMVQETRLHPSDFVLPYFLLEGENVREPVHSLPGVDRLSLDLLLKDLEEVVRLGIPAIALFPVIRDELKDSMASEALNPQGALQQALRAIKREFPQLCVITDVALDLYTPEGHDGLLGNEGEILNDASLDVLAEMSLSHAEAGADMVGPSDMMDGRVKKIRERLDQAGFTKVGVLSYTAKYASCFYSPYRDAHKSHPAKGDKKTYQMNFANRREAILEASLDEREGADILMVKPALAYLDVIMELRHTSPLPIAAYQVTGEYAMLMAAAQKGWVDKERGLLECLMSIKRAGADMIFSYGAKEAARLISQ